MPVNVALWCQRKVILPFYRVIEINPFLILVAIFHRKLSFLSNKQWDAGVKLIANSSFDVRPTSLLFFQCKGQSTVMLTASCFAGSTDDWAASASKVSKFSSFILLTPSTARFVINVEISISKPLKPRLARTFIDRICLPQVS